MHAFKIKSFVCVTLPVSSFVFPVRCKTYKKRKVGRFRNTQKTGCNGGSATIRCFPTSWRLKMMGHCGRYSPCLYLVKFCACHLDIHGVHVNTHSRGVKMSSFLTHQTGYICLKASIRKNLKTICRNPHVFLRNNNFLSCGLLYVFAHDVWHN
jgi:hypothetical protein